MPKQSPEMKEKIRAFHEENELHNMMDNTRNRARSITIGTAYGGVIEIALRNEFNNMWTVMQPVEVIEFIESAAAAVGVEIAMRPKQNFTSWRGWNYEGEQPAFFAKGSPYPTLEDSELDYTKNLLEEAREEIKQLKGEEEEEKPQLKPTRKRRTKKRALRKKH